MYEKIKPKIDVFKKTVFFTIQKEQRKIIIRKKRYNYKQSK